MDEKFSASAGNVVAGIDVGGTFTDLLLIDGKAGGKVHIAKTPTTGATWYALYSRSASNRKNCCREFPKTWRN